MATGTSHVTCHSSSLPSTTVFDGPRPADESHDDDLERAPHRGRTFSSECIGPCVGNPLTWLSFFFSLVCRLSAWVEFSCKGSRTNPISIIPLVQSWVSKISSSNNPSKIRTHVHPLFAHERTERVSTWQMFTLRYSLQIGTCDTYCTWAAHPRGKTSFRTCAWRRSRRTGCHVSWQSQAQARSAGDSHPRLQTHPHPRAILKTPDKPMNNAHTRGGKAGTHHREPRSH